MDQVRKIYKTEGKFTFIPFDDQAGLQLRITIGQVFLSHNCTQSHLVVKCQPKKSKFIANFWTGTKRISRSHLIDEYGEEFLESEFSEKIGAKALV